MRNLLGFAGLVIAGAITAVALAFGLREWLPYERLGRTVGEDQFFLWEALLWMGGLVLVLFGASAALGSLDLGTSRRPGLEEVYTFSRTARRRPALFSPGAVWAVATGVTLLIIATRARAGLNV